MADTLQVSFECLSGATVGASIGAARLAMTDQINAYPIPESSHTLLPNKSREKYLQDKLATYRELYQACRPLFNK